MNRVIVLRPEPGASATMRKALALGLEAMAVPLFEVESVEWQAPDADQFDGLLITSANAVRQAGGKLPRLTALPVYAVGAATADAAREAGLSVAATGEGGVDALLESIAPGLRLLHLCGEDRRDPTCPRQAITQVTVYRSAEISDPNLGDLSDAVILVHSPRAGGRLAELVNERTAIAIAAISAAAADACGLGWRSVDSVDEPNDDALLALAARLCQKPPRE